MTPAAIELVLCVRRPGTPLHTFRIFVSGLDDRGPIPDPAQPAVTVVALPSAPGLRLDWNLDEVVTTWSDGTVTRKKPVPRLAG